MPQTPSQIIANSGFPGPGIVAVVDQNNNIINSFGGGGGGSATDVVASGNLTSASGAGSAVQLQLGTGQATWEAQLTGTFSGGTTIAFQGSDDASSPTNWRSAVGYDSSLTNPVFITQISGPGPFIIRGPAAGYQFIQMVCTALHSGDSVAVRLIGSTGAMAGGGPVNIPDGGNIVEGTTTDANTVNTMMGRLTKIRDLLNATLTVGGTVTANLDATDSTHLGNIDAATSDLVTDLDTLITNTTGLATQSTLASVKTDLDALVTNTADLLVDGDNLATINTSTAAVNTTTGATNDAAVLGDVNGTLSAKLRGLSKILNALTDTYGTNTAISAATSLATPPTTAGLVTNSFATLTNNGYQATFSVQINVASAFVGTIGFYGLLPDGTTLQQINAHQRGTAVNGNSTAINTGSALGQTWEGSIAAFKAIYVVCSAFTSGAASVQIGLTAANYAHAILNTVSVLSPDSSITGTVTNDLDTVAITCPGGQATAYVKITGSFVGTLLFEGTPDGGTTWDAMNAVAVGASTVANQTTTTGAWRVNVSGLTSFHVKLHPTTSGTASIRINLSQGVHNVAVTNATALGQNVMVNSAPVTFASDQSAIPIKPNTTAVFTTTQTAVGSNNSGDLNISAFREISIDLNTTAQAGTSPTIQFFWERKGADGIYYVLWQSAVFSAASNTISTSVGPGLAYSQSIGTTGRLRWVVGGTATPTWTFTPNIYGK